MIEDAELTARVRDGDEQAVEELYRRHHAAVLAFAGRLCRQPQTAEDRALRQHLDACPSRARTHAALPAPALQPKQVPNGFHIRQPGAVCVGVTGRCLVAAEHYDRT